MNKDAKTKGKKIINFSISNIENKKIENQNVETFLHTIKSFYEYLINFFLIS